MDANTWFRGKLKTFWSGKGFGFVKIDGHPDALLHANILDQAQFLRPPARGVEVEVKIGQRTKGLYVTEIRYPTGASI